MKTSIDAMKHLADWHSKTATLWPTGMEQSIFHNQAAITLHEAIAREEALPKSFAKLYSDNAVGIEAERLAMIEEAQTVGTASPTDADIAGENQTSTDEFCLRGELAATLSCWHRLSHKEASELISFFAAHSAPPPSGERAAIHYPECWDTAAYPTLESALSEMYAWFKCDNPEHGEPEAQTHTRHPAKPSADPAVKQSLSTEREALIAGHREQAKHWAGVGNGSAAKVFNDTADMLAADALEIERLQSEAEAGVFVHHREMDALRDQLATAQQVAVPKGWVEALARELCLWDQENPDTVLDCRPSGDKLAWHRQDVKASKLITAMLAAVKDFK